MKNDGEKDLLMLGHHKTESCMKGGNRQHPLLSLYQKNMPSNNKDLLFSAS